MRHGISKQNDENRHFWALHDITRESTKLTTKKWNRAKGPNPSLHESLGAVSVELRAFHELVVQGLGCC